MAGAYINTTIKGDDGNQIEHQGQHTEKKDEDYDVLQFDTVGNTTNSKKDYSCFSQRQMVVFFLTSLVFTVLGCTVTGTVVFIYSRDNQRESEIDLTNASRHLQEHWRILFTEVRDLKQELKEMEILNTQLTADLQAHFGKINNTIDGSWSDWTDWGICSASCNSGLKTRSRLCNNPIPSQFGMSCVGNSEDSILCNTKACPDPMIAFTVNSPNSLLVGNSPIFRTIVENIGGGYNTTTCVFTCTQPGLYHFYVNLFGSPYIDTHYPSCYINHNTKHVAQAYVESGSSRFRSGSTSAYIRLSAGDTVSLLCGAWQYVHTGSHTMFTGALVLV